MPCAVGAVVDLLGLADAPPGYFLGGFPMATEDAAPAAEIDDIVGISEALAGLEPVKAETDEKLIDNDEPESEDAKSEDSAEDAEDRDEEKSEAESEEKDEEEESEDEDEEAPVSQERVQKRIDKLTAQKKEAL